MDSETIVLISAGVVALLFVLLAFKALTRSRGKLKESGEDSAGLELDSAEDAHARDVEAAERAAAEAAQAAEQAAAAAAEEASAREVAERAAAEEQAARLAAAAAAKAAEEASQGATEEAERAAREAAAQAAAAEVAAAEKAAAEAAADKASKEASDKAAAAEQAQRVSDENAAAVKQGLERTRSSLLGKLTDLFGRSSVIDDDVLDELEEVLIGADVGVKLTMSLVDELRDKASDRALKSADDVQKALKELLLKAVGKVDEAEDILLKRPDGPKILLFVGVNGVGKTTSIGKIGSRLVNDGHHVVMSAGDTFRAAAVEQLKVWGERTDSKVIAGEEGTDPASVIFNGVQHGVQAGADFVLCDTAGRLHTKSELMDEIKKVRRAAGKAFEGAPHEVILVVDGTSGQNALIQAREFNDAVGLTGVILTKLDGTAKGGVVVAIAHELKVPIRFVGVGEKAEDLRPFNARAFVEGLFEA